MLFFVLILGSVALNILNMMNSIVHIHSRHVPNLGWAGSLIWFWIDSLAQGIITDCYERRECGSSIQNISAELNWWNKACKCNKRLPIEMKVTLSCSLYFKK